MDYTEVYDQVMSRIHQQPSFKRERTLQVLRWLAYARAPLTDAALQHALAVQPGDKDISINALTNLNRLVSNCVGLVFVDGESRQVRFIHYTTQEYFSNEERKLKMLPEGPESITLTCLNYLSLDEFSRGAPKLRSELNMRKERYPFLEYAAKNWGHHARGNTEKSLPDEITAFLNHDGRRLSAHQCWDKDYSDHQLNVAAAFGLAHIVELLLAQGFPASESNEVGLTPLHRVAEEGDYDNVARLLLDHGASVGARRVHGWTPLHEAAKFGNIKVMRLLIERGADIHTHNNHAAPPFHEAVQSQHLAAMTMLLDEGADVKGLRPEASYISPLHLTAIRGHEPTLRLLLERGADVHQLDKEGRVALHLAAENGHLSLVKVLVE